MEQGAKACVDSKQGMCWKDATLSFMATKESENNNLVGLGKN